MRRCAVLGVGLTLLLASPIVAAQGAEEAAARALFREGLTLHESRDFARAIEKYRAAYARWQNPKILTNIGTAAWELGRFAESASAYDQFLTEAPADDASRAEVEKALSEVLPKIGTLRVAVPAGYARVRIDGAPVDPTRLDRVRVDPGTHTLDALDAAGATVRQTVAIVAGETKDVALGPAVGAPPVAPSGGAPTGAAPPDTMATGEAEKGSALPWVIGGLGATSLLASGVFYALRGGAIDDLDRQCIDGICPSSSQDTLDRADSYGTVSAVTLGLGIAGIGTAVILLATGGSSESSANASPVSISASAGPGAARAWARLRF